jgi:hypothetical protein
LAFALLAGVAACTSGQVGQYPVTHVDPAQTGALQFVVGWATGYADLGSGQGPFFGYGVNLVETFRQPSGRSAVLDDSPDVLVPPALGALIADPAVTSPPALIPGGPAYGAGFGVPPSVSSSFVTGDVAPAIGFGGPPAFQPALLDGSSLTQTFVEGYDALFPVQPPQGSLALPLKRALALFPGRYTLQVVIPTGQFSTETVQATATLRGTPLPAFAAPAFVADGNGGGSMTLDVPAGVSETLATVYATSCQTAAVQPSPSPTPTGGGATPSPVQIGIANSVFTLYSRVRGPARVFLSLPDFAGPQGPTGRFHSICTSADAAALNQPVSVQRGLAYAAGFDYPAFESVYPQSFAQKPPIAGPRGQADITISPLTAFTSP